MPSSTPTELLRTAIEAYASLRGPTPPGLGRREALDRRTEAERALFEAVRMLGELDAPEAGEALIDLLLRARHDEQLRTRVLGALRASCVPGLGPRIAARAPELGVSLLAVHRDPSVLPVLEQLIADGEQAMPESFCIAVCVAASYGHAGSRARLAELFGNPEGLHQIGWLRPMLQALASGEASATWELFEPVRRRLIDERPRKEFTAVLMSVVSRARAPDRRWAELAYATLARGGESAADAGALLARFAAEDPGVRDRLLATGGRTALRVLAELGDERARAGLMAELQSPTLRGLARTIRDLRLLPDPPEAEMEDAFVRAVEGAGEVADQEIDEVLELFARFTDSARLDALLAAFDASYLVTDAPSSERRAIEERIRNTIEAKRP